MGSEKHWAGFTVNLGYTTVWQRPTTEGQLVYIDVPDSDDTVADTVADTDTVTDTVADTVTAVGQV